MKLKNKIGKQMKAILLWKDEKVLEEEGILNYCEKCKKYTLSSTSHYEFTFKEEDIQNSRNDKIKIQMIKGEG